MSRQMSINQAFPEMLDRRTLQSLLWEGGDPLNCGSTPEACSCAGDEFHLVHVIKDETEQLREYYQEKSLVSLSPPLPDAPLTCFRSTLPPPTAHHL